MDHSTWVEIVLVRGLPGSGKTTIARALSLVGYEHHEADQWFEKDGEYLFNAADLPKAHAWCLERAKESVSKGFRCVVSNTFTQRWEMQPYVDLAKATGTPLRVVEARGNWHSIHNVPVNIIEKMRARWEEI